MTFSSCHVVLLPFTKPHCGRILQSDAHKLKELLLCMRAKNALAGTETVLRFARRPVIQMLHELEIP